MTNMQNSAILRVLCANIIQEKNDVDMNLGPGESYSIYMCVCLEEKWNTLEKRYVTIPARFSAAKRRQTDLRSGAWYWSARAKARATELTEIWLQR